MRVIDSRRSGSTRSPANGGTLGAKNAKFVLRSGIRIKSDFVFTQPRPNSDRRVGVYHGRSLGTTGHAVSVNTTQRPGVSVWAPGTHRGHTPCHDPRHSGTSLVRWPC
jgi:hypothetical protein